MRFYFFYKKENGQVAFYSEGYAEADKFEKVYLDVTPGQYEAMKNNYDMSIKDGGLVCVKSQRVINEEKVKTLEQAKTDFAAKTAAGTISLADATVFLKALSTN